MLVNAEQARGEAKKSWASIIKRLGIASLLSVLVTFPALAYTSSKGHEATTHAVCIMRSCLLAGIMAMPPPVRR